MSEERVFQRLLVRTLRDALGPGVFMTAFPAGPSGGGKGAIVRSNQWKAMGLLSGVPDLLFVYQGRAYWMELKAEKGKVSDVQVERGLELVHAGCEPPAIVRTLAEAFKALDAWGIPTRMAVAA